MVHVDSPADDLCEQQERNNQNFNWLHTLCKYISKPKTKPALLRQSVEPAMRESIRYESSDDDDDEEDQEPQTKRPKKVIQSSQLVESQTNNKKYFFPLKGAP